MVFSKLYNLVFGKEIVQEVLIAHKYKFPSTISVSIKPSEDGGYIVNITDLKGCVTQAENGKELLEMVNDAIYTYLEIPREYQPYMPVFFPSEEQRKQFNIEIPKQYFDKNLVLQKN